MSAFPLNRKPVEPAQSPLLSNEQIKLDLISSCVGKINRTKTDSISMDYKKLLIQLSPDNYYLENSGVTPLLVDALKHLGEWSFCHFLFIPLGLRGRILEQVSVERGMSDFDKTGHTWPVWPTVTIWVVEFSVFQKNSIVHKWPRR